MSAGLSPKASATNRLRPSWQEGFPDSSSMRNLRPTPVASASWACLIFSSFRRLRRSEPKAEAVARARCSTELSSNASTPDPVFPITGILDPKGQNCMKMYPLGSFGPLQRYIELNVPDRALTRPTRFTFPLWRCFHVSLWRLLALASADRCAWSVTGRYRRAARNPEITARNSLLRSR